MTSELIDLVSENCGTIAVVVVICCYLIMGGLKWIAYYLGGSGD